MRAALMVTALLRLLGCALVAAAGWTVNATVGLVLTGAALLAVTFLPGEDA